MGLNGVLVLRFVILLAQAGIQPGCHANIPGDFECGRGEKPW